MVRALGDHLADPTFQASFERYLTHGEPAVANLQRLLAGVGDQGT